ncbi:MAG: hypothetical protein GY863_20445 [bacterium]|nr:hypothetical protein [bacterium]
MAEKQSLNVVFEGKRMTISEAGGLLVRRMIEEDLPNIKGFLTNADPYKWLSEAMDKTERTIRGWTYDWESSSGAAPSFSDLILLIKVTKSTRLVEIINSLVSEATIEEQEKNHGIMLKHAANIVRDLAGELDNLADEYSPENLKNNT